MDKVTIVRQAIKAVVGEDRYKGLVIYTDNLKKNRSRLMVQQGIWAHIGDNEVKEVVNYIREHYSKEVGVRADARGRGYVPYVAFYI